jgi:hypothetical protein
MKIQVTHEDIALGVRFCAFSCPVALALEKATGLAWLVGTRTAGTEDWATALPEWLSFWIYDFDMGHPVGPIEFEIDYSDEEEDKQLELELQEA